MFATMGMCMVGCNNGDGSNNKGESKQSQETNSVLTINETKNIVLNALSINNANTLGINLNVSKTEKGNRNIFVKFGTAKLKVESAGVDFSGVFSKNQQKIFCIIIPKFQIGMIIMTENMFIQSMEIIILKANLTF